MASSSWRGHTLLPSFLTPSERRILLRSCRRLPSNPDAGALPGTSSPTRGRHHCELTARFHADWWRDDGEDASSELRRAVVAVERKTARVAAAFFAELGKRPRMTQLQLLDSVPGSADQFWHCDNTAQGLTFVIALEDVAEASGPTELLVGTQHVHDPDTGEFLLSGFLTRWCRQARARGRAVKVWGDEGGGDGAGGNGGGGRDGSGHDGGGRDGGGDGAEGGGEDGGDAGAGANGGGVRLHKAVLRSGDAFVFDSRTLHRGGANRSSSSRPVAIVRYDPSDRAPPGCGIAATSMLKVVGRMFESVAGRS
jgi:hypothetical protein